MTRWSSWGHYRARLCGVMLTEKTRRQTLATDPRRMANREGNNCGCHQSCTVELAFSWGSAGSASVTTVESGLRLDGYKLNPVVRSCG
eukprot:1890794-Amphidinium_carterae.1